MGSLRTLHTIDKSQEWQRRKSTLTDSEIERFTDYIKRLVQDRILENLARYGAMRGHMAIIRMSPGSSTTGYEIGPCSIHPSDFLDESILEELLRAEVIQTDAGPNVPAEEIPGHVLRLSDPPSDLTDLEIKVLGGLSRTFTTQDRDIKSSIYNCTGLTFGVADIRKALASLEKAGRVKHQTREGVKLWAKT